MNGIIRVSLPPGESEPCTYDHDRSIILTDWYHKSTYELATGLSSLDFEWVGEPQSLLIHGKGRFNCSGLKSDLWDTTNPECSSYVITVIPGKTYRLRIGSLTSLAALSFEIEGEAMKARQGYILPPPQTWDRVIVTLNTQNKINGYTRWSVNNVSYNLPDTPYLIAVKDRLNHVFDQTPPPDSYDSQNYDIFSKPNNTNATASSSIYKLQFNSTVDIILQNANTMNNDNNSETHPWHLHGHDFWVLGYGKGKFDINSDQKKYNLTNPIMKNTVSVQPYGWTAIRFVADNPGVWAFHCHIEAHFYLGMGVVFEEGVEMLGRYPTSITGCGDTKGYRRP
ncbi:hypothetical protein RHMOL_Rhmol10G0237000 [Rhododendron molle]|uniref:Uncharacterized protein n=1 Tax=Rhododendron molle TaxID=49168 RepID=A0ACC0M6I5_RHOML|nr:hypothetical protein RHMOL_Rhmol10G0237000 [Rhododendron molle]